MTKELRDAKENWNKRWMSLGDSIQIMEEKRVEMIKNITKAYSAMIRQVNGKEMETQCRMEQTFENITEELAITEYMTYSKGEEIAVKSPTPISKKFRQTIESKIKEYRLSRCDYSLKSLKESLENLSRKELEITPHSEQIFMTKRLNSYGIDGDNPGLRKEKTEPPTKKRQTLIFTEGKQVVGYVKAIFDYEAEEEWEISLREGDVIAVYRRNEDGWWEGEIVDGDRGAIRKRGLFPSNFTKPSK
ncbi:Cell division control protein 15 [Zancudomyces culisetae]|uniref:Cell division control protein 15 n=1 Tax=Zancudomyces culisetae TaxID=1213189 RepID=A0A1R1PDQ1_ZANCU|nr:Cell division control protein 15 [Zancudomyces culisetae]|eukprot:OMH79033.1 Cell division control protein 15 [Zancudomyces culisetae]